MEEYNGGRERRMKGMEKKNGKEINGEGKKNEEMNFSIWTLAARTRTTILNPQYENPAHQTLCSNN